MDNEQTHYSAVVPSDAAFLYPPRTISQDYVNTQEWSPIIEGARYDIVNGGIHAYFQDMKEPKHGFPFPPAVDAIDLVKRIAMIVTAIPGSLKGLPERLLFHFNRVADHVLNHVYYNKRLYTAYFRDILLSPAPFEIKRFVEVFLMNLGISNDTAEHTGRIVAHLFEYDDAYRYRLQDLMSESSQDALLNHPRKEIKRLVAIYLQRECLHSDQLGTVGDKFQKVATLVSFLLFIPPVRRAYNKALLAVRFERLQLDQSDRYHCLMRREYDYFGQPADVRRDELLRLHDGKFPEVAIFNSNQ